MIKEIITIKDII